MTGAANGRALARTLGKVGLWTMQLEPQPFARVRTVVARLEQLGYPALWFLEGAWRESLTEAALLLGATERMVIATGITNIWGRDAIAMAGAQQTLSEAYPGRFVLGLGVSHAHLVEEVRGHRYERPLQRMADYLDAMDAAPHRAPSLAVEPVRILAALGPRMLELAAKRSAGALTYLVTPEHTAAARSAMGPESLLAVEQAVVVTTDRAEARRIGRQHLSYYLPAPNYVNSWKRLGFTDADLAGRGSDRLVDALVLSGDATTIVEQLAAHFDAGADHVCLQVLDADPTALPDMPWEQLAAALPGR